MIFFTRKNDFYTSKSGDEEDYGVQTYNPSNPGKPNTPDLETLNQSLGLVSQLDYVFAAHEPVPFSFKTRSN
jgi:hypothetical protein